MTDDRYTEETVELVAPKLCNAGEPFRCAPGVHEVHRRNAEVALAALADAGLLKEPGVPMLGAAIRLYETGITYAVAGLHTKGIEAEVHLVEVREWNARRRGLGLPEVSTDD